MSSSWEKRREGNQIDLWGFGVRVTLISIDVCLGERILPCDMFDKLGYVTLRFDMPGCGESEGPRGNLICLEQVSDTRNALSFFQGQSGINPERIGVIGSSFGAAVALDGVAFAVSSA